MNISKIVRSAKCGALSALVAFASVAAVADPTVTVGEVETGEPWSKITVNYTLGGTDANLKYKVAFDVTASGQTASVTNDAANLTDGAATKEIDTADLFGKQVTDAKAKVKVTLIAIKPVKPPAGQLWADGPIWAECNVGATKPEGYGILTNFNDAAQAVTDAMGAEWRVPSEEELKPILVSSSWLNCMAHPQTLGKVAFDPLTFWVRQNRSAKGSVALLFSYTLSSYIKSREKETPHE